VIRLLGTRKLAFSGNHCQSYSTKVVEKVTFIWEDGDAHADLSLFRTQASTRTSAPPLSFDHFTTN
jgi:hypothetical protein